MFVRVFPRDQMHLATKWLGDVQIIIGISIFIIVIVFGSFVYKDIYFRSLRIHTERNGRCLDKKISWEGLEDECLLFRLWLLDYCC